MGEFSNKVDSWAQGIQDANLRVFRRAIELLAAEMNKTPLNGGTLPHLTGNLMRSQLAQINRIIEVGPPEKQYSGIDVGIAIAEALSTDEVFVGWQAIYAKRLNYGFVGADSLGREYNQEGRHFFERAVRMWPQFVARANQEIMGAL